jgi:hypothetical protein
MPQSKRIKRTKWKGETLVSDDEADKSEIQVTQQSQFSAASAFQTDTTTPGLLSVTAPKATPLIPPTTKQMTLNIQQRRGRGLATLHKEGKR